VAGGCSACLDEELAKINTHNQSASMSDQIHIVSDKEEVLNRIGHFVDKTQLYKIRLGFAESNFLIQETNDSLNIKFIIPNPKSPSIRIFIRFLNIDKHIKNSL
jgi:hypothetical protein